MLMNLCPMLMELVPGGTGTEQYSSTGLLEIKDIQSMNDLLFSLVSSFRSPMNYTRNVPILRIRLKSELILS